MPPSANYCAQRPSKSCHGPRKENPSQPLLAPPKPPGTLWPRSALDYASYSSMFRLAYATEPIVLVIALALITTFYKLGTMLFAKKWDPRGRVAYFYIHRSRLADEEQHCFVTGGSSGTGLALAVILARRGADVSIVARNQARLDKALEILEVHRHPYATFLNTDPSGRRHARTPRRFSKRILSQWTPKRSHLQP